MNDLAIKANNAANNSNPMMEISTPNQVSRLAWAKGVLPSIAPSLRPLYTRRPGHRRSYRLHDRSGYCHNGQIWWEEAGYSHERGVGQ
jgi:hypothetical protein